MKKTALALALLAATSASQALVTYTGSVDQGVTAADDDFAPGAEVLFGREVTVDEYVSVQMTALFSEADYTNAFITVGDVMFSDVISGGSHTFEFGPGLLPFDFYVVDTGRSVINGGNQTAWESGGVNPFFAVTPVQPGAIEDTEYFYLALNDNGAGDEVSGDFDFDDFVIRVDVTGGFGTIDGGPDGGR